MNFKSKKWVIPGLLILIILCIGIFAKVAFDTNLFGSDFRTMVLGTFQKNPFKKQSMVKASLIDSKLNLAFDLIDEDKSKFKAFVNNWFGLVENIETLSFGIDENMKSMLSQNLPISVNLVVSEKSIQFYSRSIPGLQNPLIKNDYEFATGSSALKVEYSDPSKYHLKIEDPKDLVNYATASGILTASSKLEGLFKSLPKVATIELNVNGKNVSGLIKLK